MPTLHSHTHCQAAPANAQTKVWQRVWLSNRTTKTTDKQADEKEARLPNMRLASYGVKWLNSSSVFQLEFCVRLTVLSSEIPHERQAQNRYHQYFFEMKPIFVILALFLFSCERNSEMETDNCITDAISVIQEEIKIKGFYIKSEYDKNPRKIERYWKLANQIASFNVSEDAKVNWDEFSDTKLDSSINGLISLLKLSKFNKHALCASDSEITKYFHDEDNSNLIKIYYLDKLIYQAYDRILGMISDSHCGITHMEYDVEEPIFISDTARVMINSKGFQAIANSQLIIDKVICNGILVEEGLMAERVNTVAKISFIKPKPGDYKVTGRLVGIGSFNFYELPVSFQFNIKK